MKVQQHNHKDIFLNFDFDNFENFIQSLIKGDEKTTAEVRGTKKSNTYKKCKEHNMAVNGSFNRINFTEKFRAILSNLQQALHLCFSDCNTEVRNQIWYKKDDYMGWHTNKYQEGQRYYLVWSQKDDASFFDYYDKGKKQTIVSPKGFSVNSFYCGRKDELLTHQVRSETNRISIGFRLR